MPLYNSHTNNIHEDSWYYNNYKNIIDNYEIPGMNIPFTKYLSNGIKLNLPSRETISSYRRALGGVKKYLYNVDHSKISHQQSEYFEKKYQQDKEILKKLKPEVEQILNNYSKAAGGSRRRRSSRKAKRSTRRRY